MSPLLDPTTQEEDFVSRIAQGFTMTTIPEPEDLLFPEERERTLSIWDDVDWWTGEGKGAPEVVMNTPKETRIAEETFAKQTPGSSGAFASAEAATMPQQFTTGDLVRKMQKKKGQPYEYGGTTKADPAGPLGPGFDCSGIIWRIMQSSGFAAFPRDAAGIYAHSKKISLKKAINTPGAILFGEGSGPSGNHIAVSLGNGKTIEAMGEAYGVVEGDAAGRFTGGGILPETRIGKVKQELRRLEGRKTRTVKKQPGRSVGAQDLTDTVPMASGADFTSALISLTDEEVILETPRGKRRTNLADIPRLKTQEEIIAYAERVAKRYGWTGEQWKALYELGQRESGWDPQADNPTSTASGIPQRLLSAHPFAPGEKQKWKDPRYQIRWFARYIAGRYGDPLAAVRFHDENGHY